MSERRARLAGLVVLLAWSCFTLRAFLGDGLPLFFDAHSHLARAWFAEQALAAGRFPTWTFSWYGGYRLFEFYAPGYHLLTGALGLVTGDVAAAAKLVLFAGQLGSVVAFYALLLRLGAPPLAALFGALLYLHDAGRWRLLAVIGNHPSLLVYAVAPLFLLAVVAADGSRRSNLRLFAAGALSLGAMAAGHLSTTAHVLPALLVFAGAWFAERLPRAEARRALGALAAAGVGFLLLTAGLSVPLLQGLPLVSLSLETARPAFELEPLAIALGLRPGSFRWIFVASPGLFWCALALGAGARSLRARQRRWRAPCAGLAASLLSIPVLGERAALGLIFFVAILCTAALESARRALERRAGPRLALALPALALLAVFVWQHVREQAPLRYVEPEALGVYARIPAGGLGRAFDVTPASESVDGVYGQSSFVPPWTGRAIPFGGFPQGAPLAANVQLALVGKLVQELAAPRPTLSSDSLDLLQLLHVGWLVDRERRPRLAALPPGADAQRLEPGLLRLAHASPALFSPRLELLSGEAPLARLASRWASDPVEARGQRSLDALVRSGRAHDWPLFLPWLRQMRIDRPAHLAERFFVVRTLARAEAAAPEAQAEFAVLAHREERESVEIVARASAPGFVRLAYAFDPALRVALDGVAAESVPDFLGGVVLAFPAGTHALTLTAPRARLRLWLLGASGAIAAVLVLVWAATYLPVSLRPK